MQRTPTGKWDVGLVIKEDEKQPPRNHEENIVVDENKELVLEYDTNASATNILVKRGVEATIIDLVPEELAQEITLELEEDAIVNFAIIQKGRFKGKKAIKVGPNAALRMFELNQGHVSSQTDVDLYKHAELISTSIYIGEPNDKIEFGCSVRHKEQSDSQLFTRGVLTDALAIYDAAIRVEKDAAHSNAHQKADALLLTDKSEAKSSPQLFIENNDITCSHAATSTHADEELLFYLMSRGLERKEAQNMMVKAFLWPVIEKLPEGFAVEQYVLERLQ